MSQLKINCNAVWFIPVRRPKADMADMVERFIEPVCQIQTCCGTADSISLKVNFEESRSKLATLRNWQIVLPIRPAQFILHSLQEWWHVWASSRCFAMIQSSQSSGTGHDRMVTHHTQLNPPIKFQSPHRSYFIMVYIVDVTLRCHRCNWHDIPAHFWSHHPHPAQPSLIGSLWSGGGW